MALLVSSTSTTVRDPSAASFGDEKSSVYSINADEYAIHALTKKDDGLLYYTKVKLNSNESLQMSDGSGPAFSGLSDMITGKMSDGTTDVNASNPYSQEIGIASTDNNKGNREWQQHTFKMDKYQYFMDDNGFLVMRFKGTDYSWANAQDGATKNWKKA